jgi:2-oxoglutarate ferredoxin oxidoreductase subunit delta
MTFRSPFSRHTETLYIRLDTSRCKACWDCVQTCPRGVLGKVDLRFHRHARIGRAENCKGCLLCLDVCSHHAILAREEIHDNAPQ